MQLFEQTSWASQSVDEEAGVVKGVKILGLESKNGRTYSPEAVASAKGLYEGMGINLDHQRGKRRVSDGFGRIRSVEQREDGLYGDLEYLKSHPFADQFVESAQRMPEQLGLSHSAEGRTKKEGDKETVESIEAVHSVDVVRYPATTKGLFESEAPEPMRVIVVEEDDPPADTPVDETPAEETPAEETPAEEAPEEEAPSEETPAEETPAEETPAEETPTEESVDPAVAAITKRLDISESLLYGGVDVTAVSEAQMETLRGFDSREEMDAFVESLPPITRRQAPPRREESGDKSYQTLREEMEARQKRERRRAV